MHFGGEAFFWFPKIWNKNFVLRELWRARPLLWCMQERQSFHSLMETPRLGGGEFLGGTLFRESIEVEFSRIWPRKKWGSSLVGPRRGENFLAEKNDRFLMRLVISLLLRGCYANSNQIHKLLHWPLKETMFPTPHYPNVSREISPPGLQRLWGWSSSRTSRGTSTSACRGTFFWEHFPAGDGRSGWRSPCWW